MLEKLGRLDDAATAYDRAAALARTDADVSFLNGRRADLAAEVSRVTRISPVQAQTK
jgi:predicted RNA polymerase sigma factor